MTAIEEQMRAEIQCAEERLVNLRAEVDECAQTLQALRSNLDHCIVCLAVRSQEVLALGTGTAPRHHRCGAGIPVQRDSCLREAPLIQTRIALGSLCSEEFRPFLQEERESFYDHALNSTQFGRTNVFTLSPTQLFGR